MFKSLCETISSLLASLLALLILSFLCFGTTRLLVRFVDATQTEAAASMVGACILAAAFSWVSALKK